MSTGSRAQLQADVAPAGDSIEAASVQAGGFGEKRAGVVGYLRVFDHAGFFADSDRAGINGSCVIST